MTITRNVNGIVMTFELDPTELREAYSEQQHLFDIQDVEDFLDCYEDDLYEQYSVTREEFQSLIPAIADETRRFQDKYGFYWDYARSDAADKIVGEYVDERNRREETAK